MGCQIPFHLMTGTSTNKIHMNGMSTNPQKNLCIPSREDLSSIFTHHTPSRPKYLSTLGYDLHRIGVGKLRRPHIKKLIVNRPTLGGSSFNKNIDPLFPFRFNNGIQISISFDSSQRRLLNLHLLLQGLPADR